MNWFETNAIKDRSTGVIVTVNLDYSARINEGGEADADCV